MLDIIENWNPDDVTIPEFHYDSICHFDYQTEFQKAQNYRDAELPFILYNHPQVDKVVYDWSNIDYVSSKLGNKIYHADQSYHENHFMYFHSIPNIRGSIISEPDGSKWKPPTTGIHTTFNDWVKLAVESQNHTLNEIKHQYFRMDSDTVSE